ncbi:hypothetical protein [Schwartzia succinivorans]|jgi:uncharacterized protein YkuJ|uniref:C2185-like N-terminal domain-containing protein n=1 Tax=Schwartzia succinivorans DSM 10502 TaxID=1123243 RepID=A0A1M4XQC3_9FIRM|nr:hypothetical protein [Schwartzia succinivorans]SHE95699.1 hypothetical protein SAMN02745190_01568 [Schwartzia succinivorans DSM 10502]
MSAALVFGCGGVGRKCRGYLEKRGLDVIAFVDNDKHKWGTFFDGIGVISPAEILSLEYQQIAIGNYKAAESIKQQLLNLGVEERKIVVPFVPKKVFKNDSILPKANLGEEQESELTRWYKRLGVKLADVDFFKKLQDLKVVLREYNIPLSEVCVVSGAVLQVLGLRESKPFDDIDIIMSSPYRELYGKGLVIVSETCEMHPQNEYDVSDDEIIEDADMHFVFNGVKFMNPHILCKHLKKSGIREETRILEKFLLTRTQL